MPNQDVPPAPETDEPVPPRFWWLKRIAAVIGLVVLVTAGVRWWWGWRAGWMLQAQIDGYRAAGEPIYPSDFDTPSIPDEENGVVVLNQATRALTLTRAQHRLADRLSDHPQLYPQHWADVRKIVEASAKARALARKARGRPRADWALRMRSPVQPFIANSLPRERELAKVLCAASTYFHHIGNDAEAVETLRDVLAVAGIMDAYPTRIAHQMSMGRFINVVLVAETITPDLRIGRPGTRPAGTVTPAGRDRVRALMAELLDERAFRQAALRAMCSYRMERLDLIRRVEDGQINLRAMVGWGRTWTPTFLSRQLVRFLRPMVQLDGVRLLKYSTVYVDAMRATTFPVAERSGPRMMTIPPKPVRPVRPFWGYAMWQSHHVHWGFMILAMRRMAATALAMRMYELDHGRRPETLAKLVPAYLAEVPADPYTEDGRKIRYRPDGKWAVLYCLNRDGGDDGGAHKRLKPRLSAFDLPFYLDAEWFRPTLLDHPGPIPLAETVKDDDVEDRQQRKRDKDQRRRQ